MPCETPPPKVEVSFLHDFPLSTLALFVTRSKLGLAIVKVPLVGVFVQRTCWNLMLLIDGIIERQEVVLLRISRFELLLKN